MLIKISEVSVNEVLAVLKKSKNKGSGPDDLSPWELKNSAIFPAPAIIKMSLIEGYIPNCLKRANVVPIAKSNHPSSINDFRPISILPTLSKVFEREVLSFHKSPVWSPGEIYFL